MNTQPRTLAALLGAGLLLSACFSGSPAPVAEASPSPAATTPGPEVGDPPESETRCPNLSDAVAAGKRVGGEVTGDVDGDGSSDASYLVRHGSGSPGCRVFLVVETADRLLSTPTSDPGTEYALQAPNIHSLVQVDGEGGLEILVNLEQGASTQFLGMFKVDEGSVQRVRFQEAASSGDLFPYGGSVGHIDASNCTETPGEVVIIQATPARQGYRLERTLYELRDEVLVVSEAHSGKPRVVPPESLSSIDELAGSPFGACARD